MADLSRKMKLPPGKCRSYERVLHMCGGGTSEYSDQWGNSFVTEARYNERTRTAEGRRECQAVPIIVRYCGTEGGGVSREVIRPGATQDSGARARNGSTEPKPRRVARCSWRDARPTIEREGTACAVGAGIIEGRTDSVVLADGRTLPVRHVVVEAETLTPSHGSIEGDAYTLADNARAEGDGGFPGQVQADGSVLNANFTRDYAADTRFAARLEAMFNAPLGDAAAFNPDLVTSVTPSVNLGAPVAGCVEGERVIFGGNNRTNIIQRMHVDPDPDYADAYRCNLHEIAGLLGIDADALDAMRRPVHVRLLDDTATPQAFGAIVELMDAMNSSEAAASPDRDRMVAATSNMDPDELARLSRLLGSLPETGALTTNLQANAPAPRAIAKHFQEAGIMRPQDARAWLTDDGAFTVDGARQVQELLMALAIRDAGAMEYIRRHQRMGSGIARSAPTLVALSQSDPTLGAELGAALTAHQSYDDSEMTLYDWQNARSLWGDGGTQWEGMTPRARTLFGFVDKKRNAQNVWPQTFKAYHEELERAARGDDRLFGDAPTPDELFADVFAT